MKGPGGEGSSSKQNGSTDHKLPSANTITRGKRPVLLAENANTIKGGSVFGFVYVCVHTRTQTHACYMYIYLQ